MSAWLPTSFIEDFLCQANTQRDEPEVYLVTLAVQKINMNGTVATELPSQSV